MQCLSADSLAGFDLQQDLEDPFSPRLISQWSQGQCTVMLVAAGAALRPLCHPAATSCSPLLHLQGLVCCVLFQGGQKAFENGVDKSGSLFDASVCFEMSFRR